jgi:hypothetical protein
VRIVVNHLTPMQQGYICVAGVDLETELHVRPVLRGTRLSTGLLTRNGGPFDMAVVVDLGIPRPIPQKPEVEDHVFDPSETRTIRTLRGNQFWALLTRIAKPKLVDIFGPDLTKRGARSCAVDVGRGIASLGCLVAHPHPKLFLRPRLGKPDQIRIALTDGDLDLDCGVTDIRLYGDDHVTPNAKEVQRIAKRLNSSMGLILSVGLTRPYAGSPDFNPVH